MWNVGLYGSLYVLILKMCCAIEKIPSDGMHSKIQNTLAAHTIK